MMAAAAPIQMNWLDDDGGGDDSPELCLLDDSERRFNGKVFSCASDLFNTSF